MPRNSDNNRCGGSFRYVMASWTLILAKRRTTALPIAPEPPATRHTGRSDILDFSRIAFLRLMPSPLAETTRQFVSHPP